MWIENNKSMEKEKMSDQETNVITEEQTPKEKTKSELFKERLAQYSTREEAGKHILEIAKDLKCAKSLGYKAIKQIEFQGETKEIEAREPTIKIPPPPISEQEPPEEITLEEEIPPPQEGVPPAAVGEIAKPPAAAPSLLPLTVDDLSWNFNLAMQKIADISDYPKFALSKDESKKLAECWLPVLNQYLPQAINNPLAWAGVTTAIIFVPRLIGFVQDRRKKQKEKVVEPPVEKSKEESPKTETKAEPPPKSNPATEAEDLEKKKMAQKPPFLNKLS
jgi:hypothetical protein